MSLIHCPECGTQQSSQAVACNKCSYPISKLNFNQTTTVALTQNSFTGLDPYYQEQFEEIQKSNEEYRGKFNWYAFWFSWIWLLTKGAFGWAVIVFLANWLVPLFLTRIVRGEIGLILGLLAAIGIAITLAHNATKVYYNVRVKGKQF
jgi:hypothetical protein